MTKIKTLTHSALKSMNRFSKIIFTYSLIITVLCFLIACSLYVYSRIDYEYYDFCVKSSDLFLKVCEYGFGTMVCSLICDIIHKCVKYDL